MPKNKWQYGKCKSLTSQKYRGVRVGESVCNYHIKENEIIVGVGHIMIWDPCIMCVPVCYGLHFRNKLYGINHVMQMNLYI